MPSGLTCTLTIGVQSRSDQMRAIVLGGYGVFGSIVCTELARRGIAVTVAGRDEARAAALAATLGDNHRAARVDAADAAGCATAIEGHSVAVCTAGPFALVDRRLVDACIEARCNWVDIADDRSWVAALLARSERLEERGLAAVWGCSSLPGISGALGVVAREGVAAAPRLARVTLFIGNDNPKGAAAIRTAQLQLGRPIRAPQGTLQGFCGAEVVELPPPFGRRTVRDFDSPDYDVLPDLLGVREVRVKAGLELRIANAVFGLLGWLGIGRGETMARLLAIIGRFARGRGSSGGAVVTELFWDDGRQRRASLSCAAKGQRMAALPAALAAASLCAGARSARGVLAAYELFGARELLEAIAREGYDLGT